MKTYSQNSRVVIEDVNYMKKGERKPQITVMLHYCTTIKRNQTQNLYRHVENQHIQQGEKNILLSFRKSTGIATQFKDMKVTNDQT